MKIEILYFEGCPNHEPADCAVRDVLAELGIEADVEAVKVSDEATAQRLKFPGSPTIRVDGEDVIPPEDHDQYSLNCRVYQTSSGFAGVPDKEAIREKIREPTA